jgi:hypothetical protein
MIEDWFKRLFPKLLDVREIDNHAFLGMTGHSVDAAFADNHDLVRMAMWLTALPVMVQKLVGCFEPEDLADLCLQCPSSLTVSFQPMTSIAPPSLEDSELPIVGLLVQCNVYVLPYSLDNDCVRTLVCS